MMPKAIAFVITIAVNLVIGAICFFFLLMALNGFRESEANWGIGAFLLTALFASTGTALAAAGAVHLMMSRRKWGAPLSLAVFVPLFVIVGGTINSAGIVIGALVADIVRGM